MIPDFGQTRILVFEYEKHIFKFRTKISIFIHLCRSGSRLSKNSKPPWVVYVIDSLHWMQNVKVIEVSRRPGNVSLLLCSCTAPNSHRANPPCGDRRQWVKIGFLVSSKVTFFLYAKKTRKSLSVTWIVGQSCDKIRLERGTSGQDQPVSIFCEVVINKGALQILFWNPSFLLKKCKRWGAGGALHPAKQHFYPCWWNVWG